MVIQSLRAANLLEALEYMADNPKTTIVAGATDLMVLYKHKRGLPARIPEPLVFIDNLSELKLIEFNGGQLHIGAGVTYTELLNSELVPMALKQVVLNIAAPAIRNRGTLGGNICNASPAGDTLPLLTIYNTRLKLTSVAKENDKQLSTREVLLADYILAPRKTARTSRELLTEIIIPLQAVPRGSLLYTEKVANRQADAIAKLSFAGLIILAHQPRITAAIKVKEVRFAFGSVGPKIVRSQELEQKLVGESWPLSAGVIGRMIADYHELIQPIDDQRSTAVYRKQVCLNLLKNFLQGNGGVRVDD